MSVYGVLPDRCEAGRLHFWTPPTLALAAAAAEKKKQKYCLPLNKCKKYTKKSTSFTVIVFFRIFAFGGLNFSHSAPNIHLFRHFCCQKYPKFENNAFFILQAENSPHNSIAVSNVHNVQSYLIFPNFSFWTLELFSPHIWAIKYASFSQIMLPKIPYS